METTEKDDLYFPGCPKMTVKLQSSAMNGNKFSCFWMKEGLRRESSNWSNCYDVDTMCLMVIFLR